MGKFEAPILILRLLLQNYGNVFSSSLKTHSNGKKSMATKTKLFILTEWITHAFIVDHIHRRQFSNLFLQHKMIMLRTEGYF